LLQSGAYLRSVTNRKINSNGVEFTKKNLVFASEQVNNPYTLRAISKSLRDIIVKVSFAYEIPGHIYSQFKLENANYVATKSKQEILQIASYCTDFQLDNLHTPSIVREFLAIREQARQKFSIRKFN
jgi:2-phosphoglycerate kinase